MLLYYFSGFFAIAFFTRIPLKRSAPSRGCRRPTYGRTAAGLRHLPSFPPPRPVKEFQSPQHRRGSGCRLRPQRKPHRPRAAVSDSQSAKNHCAQPRSTYRHGPSPDSGMAMRAGSDSSKLSAGMRRTIGIEQAEHRQPRPQHHHNARKNPASAALVTPLRSPFCAAIPPQHTQALPLPVQAPATSTAPSAVSAPAQTVYPAFPAAECRNRCWSAQR